MIPATKSAIGCQNPHPAEMTSLCPENCFSLSLSFMTTVTADVDVGVESLSGFKRMCDMLYLKIVLMVKG